MDTRSNSNLNTRYYPHSSTSQYLNALCNVETTRTPVIDHDLKNLQDTDWAAYPSGHAANSYINAFIYQKLAPEFTDIFVKDAYDMVEIPTPLTTLFQEGVTS